MMSQDPSPTTKALRQQADRYAIAIGALAGLIQGLLSILEVWQRTVYINIVARMAVTLVFFPYVTLGDLVAAKWFAHVRRLGWIYGGLAGLVLLRLLAAPPPFEWLTASRIVALSMLVGAGASLIFERRTIRPKL
jgi:hypothetical protein